MWQSLLCLVMYCGKLAVNLLRGQEVAVTSVLNEPYMMLKSNAEELSGNDKYEGLLVDVLEEMEHILGSHFNIHIVKDGSYGIQAPNGTWKGMINEIIRGEADIAVGDMTIFPERVEVVDWTIPFMSSGFVPVTLADSEGNAPTSLEQVVEKGMEIYTYCCGKCANFFMTTEDPFFSKVDGMLKKEVSYEDGIKRVLEGSGNVALLMEYPAARYYAKKNCSLRIVGEPFTNAFYSFALHKGAAFKADSGEILEYRSFINYALTKIQNSGDMAKFYKKWMGDGHEC